MDFILAIVVALPIFLLCFSLGKTAEIYYIFWELLLLTDRED